MGNHNKVTLRRTLSLPMIVLYGLAFMAPGVSLATFGTVTAITNGAPSSGYLVMLIIMLFTVYSYSHMVKAFPNAGSAYTYTSKAINRHFGFIAGWTVLLDYFFAPVFNSVLFAVYMSAAFPSISFASWIILFVVIITIINIVGVNFSSKISLWLLLFQFFVVVIFIAFAIKAILGGGGTGTLFSISPFIGEGFILTNVLAAAPLLYLGFLGFDFVTTLSEETYNPKKTIPKAMFLIAIIGGVLGIIITYIATMVYPDISVINDLDSAAYEIFIEIAGAFGGALFVATNAAGSITSSAACHTSASRILYVMGREAILPKSVFGYLSPKSRVPIYNIILLGVCTLVAMFMDLNDAASYMAFGVAVGFTLVNISVIFYFYIKNKKRSLKETINYLIMPLIGASFTITILFQIETRAFVFGASWLAVSFVYLMFLTNMFRKAPPGFNDEESAENSKAL